MRSSPFDDHDGTGEDSTQLSSNSIWRRPWWRWNLFTLFAVLFAYVWVRELLSWTAEITILGLMAILGVWLIVPLIPNLLDSGSKVLTLTSDAIKKYHKKPKPPKYMILLVARWFAVLVCMFALVQFLLEIGNLLRILSMNNTVTGFMNGTWQLFIQLMYAIANSLFHIGLSIALWMLADILQNQEEIKSKQQDGDMP